MIAELQYGGDRLNLVGYRTDESRFDLAEDFNPPESGRAVRYGRALDWGQVPVDETAENVSWAFTVHVHGDTASDVKRGIRTLQAFLRQAGSEHLPLYFAWRAYGDEYPFEPRQGSFGKYSLYEIVHGDVIADGSYEQLLTTETVVSVRVSVTTKPFSVRRILAGIASGSVIEDIYGSPNGKSRGLRVNPATTNYITNPIFDNPDTWSQGWTAGGDLYFDQNTNPRYALFGGSSARVVYDGAGTGGTADALLISCATSALSLTMTISCFVKKVDNAPILSSDFFFVRGSTSIIGMNSPIYVGDGWYWCSVATTSNGTSNYGIRLQTAGRYLYVDGFQLEYQSYPTFLCYGDQVGSTWAGTPHASNSSRTGGSVKWPRPILLPSYSEGTVRLAWRPDFPSKYVSSGAVYYLYSDNVIDISYDGTNNRFAASDGTNTVHSGSTILAQETTYVVHLTFDATNGLALYVDGVEEGTNATYTLPPVAGAGTQIYLGSSTSAADQAEGTLYAFGLFDRVMTAAAVAVEVAELLPLLTAGERVDDIPWLWTLDGGGVVYNQNDADDGNYAIAGGFGGDVVIPELYLTSSTTLTNIGEIHLGRLAVDQRDFAQIIASGVPDANGRNLLFHDKNVTADATCSGGQYEGVTLSTTAVEISLFSFLYSRQNTYFAGKPVAVMGRVRDEGGGGAANLRVALTYHFGTRSFVTDYKNLPALSASTYGLIEFGQAAFPPTLRYRPEGGMWDRVFATSTIKRASGSGAFRTDYICNLPYPLHINVVGNLNTMVVLRGRIARCVYGSWATGQAEVTIADTLETEGWPLEFEGDRLNIVPFLLGKRAGADGATITWALTINECWLIIRNNLD